MSLHYILDGYNIIKNSKLSFPDKLEDQRTALINFIKENKPCGSMNNKITVVFDAKKAGLGFLNQEVFDKSNIRIIFASQESADEKIKNLVESSKNPKNIIVVSDDKGIKFFIKSCGAVSLSPQEFINKTEVKLRKAQRPLAPELSYSQAEKINRELKKIWLKDGG